MKKNRIALTSFKPKPSDKILLDTNILINLFYSTNFDATPNVYETLLAAIISNTGDFLISSVQISEFINTCIRIQFKLYQTQVEDPTLEFKKHYRSSGDYREKMNAILDIVKTELMTHFSFIDDGFCDMNPDRIFVYGFSYDFNDALLAEIARKHKAILITNDNDFANYGTDFQIVTSNKFLLMGQ